ncbi:MAG: hypothetical protein VW103_10535 [Halieaceae bacterium]|jgi:hypothetical protein
MQLNLTASVAVLLLMFSHGAVSETIAGASYKDVCKKMEQEGVASRTQSGGNTEEIAANVVVVVGTGHSTSRRRNAPVSNSDIVVGANVTQISTHNDALDHGSDSAAGPVDTCE